MTTIDPRDPGMSAGGALPTTPTIATHRAYDALNRLQETLDGLGGSTGIARHVSDQPSSVDDPLGLVTSYDRNGYGEVRTQTSPDTGQTTWTYDRAGNRVTQTDARGVTAAYSYDALNRLTYVEYDGQSTHAENQTYTYDQTTAVSACGGTQHGLGRLTAVADLSGTTQFVYDGRGNVVCKAVTIEGLDTYSTGTTWVTRYAYDAADRLEEITYPSGVVVQYVRDAMGRITSVTAAPNGTSHQTVVSNVTYAPFGPVTGWQFRGGADSAVRTYDRAYRPLTIRYLKNGTTPYKDWTYDYDKAGNIINWTSATQTSWSTTYQYDYNGWLREELTSTGFSLEYVYDANGNRLERRVWGAEGATYDYDWSPLPPSNRLREVVNDWVWIFNHPSGLYTYDSAGSPSSVTMTDDSNDMFVSTFAHGATGRMTEMCIDFNPAISMHNPHDPPACTRTGLKIQHDVIR